MKHSEKDIEYLNSSAWIMRKISFKLLLITKNKINII